MTNQEQQNNQHNEQMIHKLESAAKGLVIFSGLVSGIFVIAMLKEYISTINSSWAERDSMPISTYVLDMHPPEEVSTRPLEFTHFTG